MTTATVELELSSQELEIVNRANGLTVNDDVTEAAALMVIADLKDLEKKRDQERRAQTDPLNLRITYITAPYTKLLSTYKACRDEMEKRLGLYRTGKAQRLAAEQQRLIEEKRKADAETAALAAKEKEKADKLAAELSAKNRPLTSAEMSKLATVEAKAVQAQEQAAVQAAMPVAVVEQMKKTVDLGNGTKMQAVSKSEWVFKNATPRGTKIARSDPRFKDIPDSCFLLHEPILSNLVKGGLLPSCCVLVDGTTLRKTK